MPGIESRGFYDQPPGSLVVFDVLNRDGCFVRQMNIVGIGDPFRDRYYFFDGRL
jgi:hypothetical protein